MSAPKPYNGHHCWNCWNVALWIAANDESLYFAALECKRRPKASGVLPGLRTATNRMLGMLPARTPDGARYTFKAVRAALEDLE